MTTIANTCPDCGVPPGQYHDPYCDVPRCVTCGGQALSCAMDDEHVYFGSLWSGIWPGIVEVNEGLATDLNHLAERGFKGELVWDGDRWQLDA